MDHESAPYIFSVCIAATAQALMYFSRAANGEAFKWVDFIASVLLSAVMGLIICMAAHANGMSYELSGALAGVGGLMGKELAKILEQLVKAKLGVEDK